MIPRDVVFHRAETATEAVRLYRSLEGGIPEGQPMKDRPHEDRTPFYFSGGTEIVTLARENKIVPTDLIDIKAIPETRTFAVVAHDEVGPPGDGTGTGDAGEQLQLGAALPLNVLVDSGVFPLLSACSGGVADRTTRNSITLGGNICGMLPYRETVLPFLVLESRMEVAAPPVASPAELDAPAEIRRVPVLEAFRKKVEIARDEFVVRFIVNAHEVHGIGGHPRGAEPWRDSSRQPFGPVVVSGSGPRGGWFYFRRTADSRIDYPIATIVMVLLDGKLRIAVTGTWGYPYRAKEAEAVYGETRGKHQEPLIREEAFALAEAMVDSVALKIRGDMRAGVEYRREVTVQGIAQGLMTLDPLTAGQKEERGDR